MTEKTAVTSRREAANAELARGLEGVIAAISDITYLDGQKGQMLYKGYNAPDLAGRTKFEEVVHLLWEGELPTKCQLDVLSKSLAAERAVPPEVYDILRALPPKAHPMAALRTAVSYIGASDPEADVVTLDNFRKKAVSLTAKMATLTAAWDRIRKGQKPVEPDPSLSHAANFLYMLNGRKPDALSEQAIDVYLTLLADHELNASTFTGRLVVSTLSDYYSAVTAALGTLKGSLHGGANEMAMKMFIEIGDPAKAESYVEKAIAGKKKIMGFGHRVYRVEDPRSAPLKEMLRKISEARKDMRWYDISVKVAEVVHKHKNINTNVDFYSASVLYLCGIDPDLFTPMFAVSRIAGWSAHVFEQFKDNRLIRPASEYVGPPLRPLVSIDQRK
jgi:citrate synthase